MVWIRRRRKMRRDFRPRGAWMGGLGVDYDFEKASEMVVFNRVLRGRRFQVLIVRYFSFKFISNFEGIFWCFNFGFFEIRKFYLNEGVVLRSGV